MFRTFTGTINSEWNAKVSLLPRPNKDHDGYAIRENNVVIADGATPLEESWGNDLFHWVGTLSGLMAYKGRDLDLDLSDVWRDAIRFNNTIFAPQGIERTMGCSHARINNDALEYVTVGDTRMVVKHLDGTYTEIFDTRLAYWEEKADKLIDEGSLTPRAAAWHNRLRANAIGGYEVVSDNDTVAERSIVGSIPLNTVDSVLLCTDGFWRLFDTPEEMFDAVNLPPKKLESLLAKLSPSDDLAVAHLTRS